METPKVPTYSKAKPVPDGDCVGCGENLFPTEVSGKETEVIAGTNISVEDLSDAVKNVYRVNHVPFVALTVDLTLVAKAASIVKNNPILKGTVIDEVNLTWSYNKVISLQTLTNTGGLLEPTLGVSDVSLDYTGETIQSDISFTLEGNDGSSQAGGIQSDTESILFGNYMLYGHNTNLTDQPVTDLNALYASFTKEIKTSRSKTLYATGGANEHHIVMYPKAWGLATFKKGIFEGGYVRMKNVSGTLKQTLGVGDVEQDILFTNSEGYEEAYYVYMTLFDNQDDPNEPIIIS